ncbi:MAG TPA: hypothetical protein VES42_27095 [Pilimelia sp.]|nr:hypothetical protein [Pilimelia sp.]
MTGLALAVDRVFIELPHLRRYFYAGATRGSATDGFEGEAVPRVPPPVGPAAPGSARPGGAALETSGAAPLCAVTVLRSQVV